MATIAGKLGPADLTLDLQGGRLRFWQTWLPEAEAAAVAEEIAAQVTLHQESITLFGKTHPQPRLTGWFGAGLSAASRYSQTMPADPWPPRLDRLRMELAEGLGCPFASALVNVYRDGQDGMGMHADDEPVWGADPLIASLSFGGTRRFVFKHRITKERQELALGHGSLLVMDRGFQSSWIHGVPKTKKPVERRINVTLRPLT